MAFGKEGPGVVDTLSHLGNRALRNPAGAAAIGIPTAALAYLAYKALRGGGQEREGSMGDGVEHQKMASFGLTPELCLGLEKIAQDPGIKAACFILDQYGLLPR